MITCKTDQKPKKWYNSNIFPIIPQFKYKPACDSWDTSNWSFHWLFFKLWSLDAFEFELSIAVSSHWGIALLGIFPYTRWVIGVPLPYKVTSWVQRKLWRHSKSLNEIYEKTN
jgi:membrane-associated phospholipid phosphatase